MGFIQHFCDFQRTRSETLIISHLRIFDVSFNLWGMSTDKVTPENRINLNSQLAIFLCQIKKVSLALEFYSVPK